MKKALLLTIAGIFYIQIILAQKLQSLPDNLTTTPVTNQPITKANGEIMGVILDENTQRPVESATITIINKETDKITDVTVSDDKGKFSLGRIANGQYQLFMTYPGYETKIIHILTIGEGVADIGAVTLKVDAGILKEFQQCVIKPR